jgi:DNA-binding NtrC family response regulator
MNEKILVVDDDKLVNEFVEETLTRSGYDVTTAMSAEDALELIEIEEFDLILSDVRMPRMDGIELLKRVRKLSPSTVVIMITAFGTVKNAVEAMKIGAFDYILKPFPPDELELNVKRALQLHSLQVENDLLRGEVGRKYSFESIVGKNKVLTDVFDLVRVAADSKATILITGESGTGKELFARAIHYNSPRKAGPFIRVNCASLPENLIESELFGHEKGAFTGAIRQSKGRFELADGGTILLDEISEMPMSLQAKLLRVLQEHEFERVGSGVPIQVDVRVIATTNRHLWTEIREGNFREDLFYRLNVIQIEIPPLRARKDDIHALVSHFIEKYNNENGRTVGKLADNALRTLMAYHWPGNVRELENVIQRGVVTCKGDTITNDDIPSYLSLGESAESGSLRLPMPVSLSELEKVAILEALKFTSGNRTKAADVLGITSRTLRNKLAEYGMKQKEPLVEEEELT